MAPEGHIYISIKPKYSTEKKTEDMMCKIAAVKDIKTVEMFYFNVFDFVAKFKTSNDNRMEELVQKIGSMEEVSDVKIRKLKRRVSFSKKGYRTEDL